MVAFSILIKENCTPAAPGKYLCSSRAGGSRGAQGTGRLRRRLPGRQLRKRDELVSGQRAPENLPPPRQYFWLRDIFLVGNGISTWKREWGESFCVTSARRLCRRWAPSELSEFSLSAGSSPVPPPAGYELLIRRKDVDHNTMNCTRVETRQVLLAYVCWTKWILHRFQLWYSSTNKRGWTCLVQSLSHTHCSSSHVIARLCATDHLKWSSVFSVVEAKQSFLRFFFGWENKRPLEQILNI